ncbi:hypothetical protein V499_08778 [Pseudogymnoascus sp. VKM F-103]|nr:hypothetical protein V499_08778 [Pseudogymnoascus sp. VKM F-103]
MAAAAPSPDVAAPPMAPYTFAFSPFLLRTYRFGVDPSRPPCKAYAAGHCPLGASCPDRHIAAPTGSNYNNLGVLSAGAEVCEEACEEGFVSVLFGGVLSGGEEVSGGGACEVEGGGGFGGVEGEGCEGSGGGGGGDKVEEGGGGEGGGEGKGEIWGREGGKRRKMDGKRWRWVWGRCEEAEGEGTYALRGMIWLMAAAGCGYGLVRATNPNGKSKARPRIPSSKVGIQEQRAVPDGLETIPYVVGSSRSRGNKAHIGQRSHTVPALSLITDTQLLCGLSTTALAAEEIRSICGLVLNEAITAFMTADPNTPALGSPREWKNYRRKRQLAAAVEAAVTRTVGDKPSPSAE